MLALAAVVLLHRLCVLHLAVLMLASQLHSSSVLLGTLAGAIASDLAKNLLRVAGSGVCEKTAAACR